MLQVVDAHCHLDGQYFSEGPDAVIARAREVGVVGLVVVGLVSPDVSAQGNDPLQSARFAVELARRHPHSVAACVGLHPHDARAWTSALHEGLRSLALQPEVVAVGEIGLDYHYDHSPREQQRTVFARLIGLAREVHKPIVVHTREAAADTLVLLEEHGARDVGGVIHCFSEDLAFAERALDLDLDLSFSGIVTFQNARTVQQVAAWAPAERILVETDSPYLAPVPRRGKRCEPAFVVHTLSRLAALRAAAPEALGRTLLENTQRRFGKAFTPAANP